uniref:cAMP-specific 3',5'-cyclic phosphodiesterase 4B n=1 Tax=Sarcophilus harrisii TaxID=9305 RepID=A0A7N4V6M7_SARHA
MKKSRSVMTVTADENVKDYLECGLSKSYSSSSNTLGIDLWRGRRCCSGNLQLPPLSQRQSERARTPDGDSISRPTTLPLLTLPSIAITTVSQERETNGIYKRAWKSIHLDFCLGHLTRSVAVEKSWEQET